MKRFEDGFIRRGAMPIAALAAAGAVLSGCDSHTPKDTDSDQYKAALAVAQRYECTLESVEDTGQIPTINDEQSKDRTTVHITVRLQDVPSAKPALQKYDKDNTVTWFPPQFGGTVHYKSGDSLLIQGPIMPYLKPLETDDTATIDLYPLHNYAQGSLASLAVSEEVHTDSLDRSKLYTFGGTSPCGAMVFDTGKWVKSDQPSAIPPSVEISSSKWLQ